MLRVIRSVSFTKQHSCFHTGPMCVRNTNMLSLQTRNNAIISTIAVCTWLPGKVQTSSVFSSHLSITPQTTAMTPAVERKCLDTFGVLSAVQTRCAGEFLSCVSALILVMVFCRFSRVFPHSSTVMTRNMRRPCYARMPYRPRYWYPQELNC